MKTLSICAIATVLVVAAFLVSSIPYKIAQDHTGADRAFLGQLIYSEDQTMYFSFIRQAWGGHALFNNRLTHIENGRYFVNLEWLMVGTLWRLTGLSENGIYQLWRLLGILSLVAGFLFLSARQPVSGRRKNLSFLLFVFGGGFGTFFLLAHNAGFITDGTETKGTLDLWTGFIPFQQMISNPHFSFPYGVLLFGYGLFLMGEKTGRRCFYAAAGTVFAAQGAMRPYDLITLFTIIPCFIVIEMFVGPDWKRKVFNRSIPLLIALPVLWYFVLVFHFFTVFKFWAQQGSMVGCIPFPQWHYLTYGVAGLLAAGRVACFRAQPITVGERLCIVWFVAGFLLTHAGRVVPVMNFSPQIGITIAAPLVLLGRSAALPDWSGVRRGRPRLNCLGAAIVVLCICLYAGGVVFYFSQRALDDPRDEHFYADKGEVAAWQWINDSLAGDKVILATPLTSRRLCKYTDERVTNGHWSVTPNYYMMKDIVNGLMQTGEFTGKEKKLFRELRADYLYCGPNEKPLCRLPLGDTAYFNPRYKNATVALYEVRK